MKKILHYSLTDLIQLGSGKKVIFDYYFKELYNNIISNDYEINSFSKTLKYNNRDKSHRKLVPFSVKDIIDTAGIRTSYGSEIFKYHIPDRDAEVVKRLIFCGLQLQGKTNTHEFAMGIVTPQCRNPWDISRITGGSSGGSAAAVAACFSPFSIGTDTAGSIRIPASFCGVTGLKPSYGLFPLDGIFPEAPSLDTVGPITRFASDLPQILQWMGASENFIVPVKFPVKTALIEELFQQAEKPILDTIMSFLYRLEKQGIIEIHRISLPDIEISAIYDDIIDSAENYSIHRNLFSKYGDIYSELSRIQLRNSKKLKAYQYIEATKFRKIWSVRISSLLRKYDVLVSPTSPEIAPLYSDIVDKSPEFFLRFMKFTNPFNLSSSPSLSIPCGFHNDMPVGMQITGKRMSDFYICRVAAEFQKVTDYHLDTPDRFAKYYNEILESTFLS